MRVSVGRKQPMPPPSTGAMGSVRESHNEWYKREVERGRRFHGAWSGGFSAGYHNTVGSERGWEPSAFRSSRSDRAQVKQLTPAEIGDEEDGLLGGRLTVSDAYERGGEEESGSRATLRLLRRRRKARLGPDDLEAVDEDLAVEAAKIAIKTDRHCIGYSGSLDESARSAVYRVSDLLSSGSGSGSKAIDRGASGFALADDEDDVYEGASRRPTQLVVLEEDDNEDAVAFPRARESSGRRLEQGRRGKLGEGVGLPGFKRALERDLEPAVSANAPQPPADWRPARAFAEPPLDSPWRRAAQLGRRPAKVAVLRQDPRLDDLRSAMSGRFAATTTTEQAAPIVGGLSRPRPRQREPAPEESAKSRREASWARQPTRRTDSWQPLPLVSKRFGWPLPRRDSTLDLAALRDRQFAAPSKPVTTATRNSKLYDATIGQFLPDDGPARGATDDDDDPFEKPPQPQATPLPSRPAIDLFKAVFESTDDTEEFSDRPPADDQPLAAPAPIPGFQPPLPSRPADLFADLLGLPSSEPPRPREEPRPPPVPARERGRRDDSDNDRPPKKHKKEKKKKKKHHKRDDDAEKHRRKKHKKAAATRRRDASDDDSEPD